MILGQLSPSETSRPYLIVTYFSWLSELGFSFCVEVHYSITVKTKSIILGIHLLLDHVISVPYPHLALTKITWSSDFALYLWLYLIDKHHALDTCSDLHCK